MEYSKICFVGAFLLLVFAASAQNISDYERSYNNGKDLFEMGKYELAMEALKPLTRQDAGNPYTEYASFYFALSAKNAGQQNIAKDMLLQLVERYPGWEKIDDVHYWLSEIYFIQKEYNKALNSASKIKDKAVQKDAQAMALHYLVQINEIASLKDLLQQNPYNAEVAKVLALKISERQSSPENRQLLDFLISEFDLDEEKYNTAALGESKKKDSYNVAVFFPFMLDELDQERSVRSNQFVLDTYEGIKLAVEKLKEEGKSINLYAYDTRRDSATTANILIRPEIKQMDLIVGPLYPASSKLTSDFAYRYKINMVNPLSSNSEVIGGNPMSFLFKPSLETQAKAAASYSSEAFMENPNTMIVYGEASKDSILAFNYKKVAEERGLKVNAMIKIGQSNSRQIIRTLTEENERDTTSKDLGHLFVASAEELIVANVISALEMRGDKLPVVTLADWLDLNFVSFEQLERLSVRFIAPNYVNHENGRVEEFKETFSEETNRPPSQFAYSGYDMMLFFGTMLHEYGTYFQKGFVDKELVGGDIFAGYLFKEFNDNQFVPIVQFKEAALELVNQQ